MIPWTLNVDELSKTLNVYSYVPCKYCNEVIAQVVPAK